MRRSASFRWGPNGWVASRCRPTSGRSTPGSSWSPARSCPGKSPGADTDWQCAWAPGTGARSRSRPATTRRSPPTGTCFISEWSKSRRRDRAVVERDRPVPRERAPVDLGALAAADVVLRDDRPVERAVVAERRVVRALPVDVLRLRAVDEQDRRVARAVERVADLEGEHAVRV